MKYLKTFEIVRSYNKIPEIGDYIISDYEYSDKNWSNYINSKIGKFIKIYRQSDSLWYIVTYEIEDFIVDQCLKPTNDQNIIKIIDGKNFIDMHFKLSEIKYLSGDKEELEALLAANKYNL